MLSRRHGAVGNRVRKRDKRGHLAAVGTQSINHRSIGRPEVEGVSQPLIITRRRMAGESVVAGGVMVLHGVGHAVNQRHPVHPLRHLGEMLRNGKPRHHTRNRRQWPTDLGRCIRLEIKGVEVTRPSPLKEKDHPLRSDGKINSTRDGSASSRHLQPQQPSCSRGQQRPPAKRSLMKALTASMGVRHEKAHR